MAAAIPLNVKLLSRFAIYIFSNRSSNTVIQFTLHNESYPRIFRINSRDTNLIKISQANEILL
jgi:uncharacterized membrane protein YjjP (DUF1212 family)